MFNYRSNGYVAKMIRAGVRNCIKKSNGSKSLDLKSTIWRLKTIGSNWDPEYGCSLAWDDSINAWVTSRDKNLDYFNIACQAMANMYKVNILTIYKWYYEIRPLFIDQENERFQLPSTKEVIEYLFKKDE